MTVAFPPAWVALNNYDPAQIQRRVDIFSTTFVVNTIAVTVPGHEIWHPLAIRFTVTTSATAGNRFPRLTYRVQGATVVFPVINGIQVAPSQTQSYVMFANQPLSASENVGTVTTSLFGMPDVYLGPGDQLQLVINQIQAGDTCSVFQAWNEVMFTEPGAPPEPGQTAVDRMADAEHALELSAMPGLR